MKAGPQLQPALDPVDSGPEPEPQPPPISSSSSFARRVGWAIRVVVGFGLILLSVWSLLLPVSVPISTIAAVTARVAMVSSPLKGEVRSLSADVGDHVLVGQLLAEVANTHSDEDKTFELRAQRADLETQRGAVENELRETAAVKATYEARYREFTKRTVKEAKQLLAESMQDGRSRLGEQDPKSAALDSARTARLQAAIEDARAGYDLHLGIEPPRLARLSADLDLRVAQLTAERGRLKGLAANMDGQIRELEREREALARRRVASPVKGVVWTRPVNVGQFVESGTELYKIADESRLHIQAYFHRRYLTGMAIGDKAAVYLVAANKVVSGTIRVIQAINPSGARDQYAVDLPAPDDNHFKVIIELDRKGQKLAKIGGVAKVAVVGRADTRFKRAMMWLYLRFES